MVQKFTYVDESFPYLAKNFKDQTKTHVTKSCKDYVKLICPCCGGEYSSKKIICQYTLDDKLKHIYIRKEELPDGMYFNNIWRSCVNQRETAYGYKWKILDKKDEFEIFEMIRANQFARFYFAN